MNAKDLERLLAKNGANPTAVDVVVRKLRRAVKHNVSVTGRGTSAHDLAGDEISWIVATYAGSEVASRAAETLGRLIKLRSFDSDGRSRDFFSCFLLILTRDIKDEVSEIRIARNADFAQIKFKSRPAWDFVNFRRPNAALPAFLSEGVISAGLIDQLAEIVIAQARIDDHRNRQEDKVIEWQGDDDD